MVENSTAIVLVVDKFPQQIASLFTANTRSGSDIPIRCGEERPGVDRGARWVLKTRQANVASPIAHVAKLVKVFWDQSTVWR